MEKKYYLPADKIEFMKDSIEKLKAENKDDHDAGEFDRYNFEYQGRYRAFQEVLQWMNEETRLGPVWVKASEFKTHVPVWRPYRIPCLEDEGEYDYGEIYVTEDDGRIYLDVDNECNYEHQSDERWNDYEILDESGAAPSGEREVAFAEWIRKENYKPYAGWWYLNGNNYANQPCSTAQLYELFKQPTP